MMTIYHQEVALVLVVDGGLVLSMTSCPEVQLENPARRVDRLLWIVETTVTVETTSPQDSTAESLPHIKGPILSF